MLLYRYLNGDVNRNGVCVNHSSTRKKKLRGDYRFTPLRNPVHSQVPCPASDLKLLETNTPVKVSDRSMSN